MRVEFLAPATKELVEALAHYNEQSEGLGYRFASQVRKTLARIVQYPHAWPPISKRTRRCRTIGFPYGVIYQASEGVILVVAVMHLHRHPDSWKSRLPYQ
jgi:plasmid stabilization system protein ParE